VFEMTEPKTIGKESKEIVYSKKLYVGRDTDNLKVYIEIELEKTILETYPQFKDTPLQKETVTHDQVTEYTTLTISGFARKTVRSNYAYCGQIYDHLSNLAHPCISQDKLDQIIAIWQRWHLNDLHAACVHQTWFDSGVAFEIWQARANAETAKCPKGYRYGSKWLLEPLPQAVIDAVKSW
jgi:hypothetical protein